MFKNISWSSFISCVVVLVIPYYIVIGIMYFRGDIVRLFREGFRKQAKQEPAPFSLSGTDMKSDPVLFSSVHELMQELKDLFFTAAGKGYHQEELVMALQSTLKRYTNLKDTKFEEAINTHILQSASSICTIELDDTAIRQIW